MTRSPPLEPRVLDALRGGGALTVREVRAAVDPGLAHTTYATVLDRLHQKGLVHREKVDGAWAYAARLSREAALAAEVGAVLQRAQGAPEPLLVAFLDEVEAVDPDALDRLEALLRARRGGP